MNRSTLLTAAILILSACGDGSQISDEDSLVSQSEWLRYRPLDDEEKRARYDALPVDERAHLEDEAFATLLELGYERGPSGCFVHPHRSAEIEARLEQALLQVEGKFGLAEPIDPEIGISKNALNASSGKGSAAVQCIFWMWTWCVDWGCNNSGDKHCAKVQTDGPIPIEHCECVDNVVSD